MTTKPFTSEAHALLETIKAELVAHGKFPVIDTERWHDGTEEIALAWVSNSVHSSFVIDPDTGESYFISHSRAGELADIEFTTIAEMREVYPAILNHCLRGVITKVSDLKADSLLQSRYAALSFTSQIRAVGEGLYSTGVDVSLCSIPEDGELVLSWHTTDGTFSFVVSDDEDGVECQMIHIHNGRRGAGRIFTDPEEFAAFLPGFLAENHPQVATDGSNP